MNRRAPADRAKKRIKRTRGQVEALEAALAASQARAAEAKVSDAQAQIAALTLMIEKLRRVLYGRRSERSERLLGQLELELDELTASATEDDLTAETAPGRTTQVTRGSSAAGSDRGGERAAAMYTLIGTAKLNDVDPQAWLADVLGRIAALPHARVHELLPWNWKAARDQTPVA